MTPGATLDRTAAIPQSGWSRPVRFYQPHNPAFWVYWGLVLLGAYLFYAALRHYSVKPSFLVLAVVLQILYMLPFLWFITRADRYEREHRQSSVCWPFSGAGWWPPG